MSGMKNFTNFRKLAIVATILLASTMMMAQTVPQQISFQGKLMESGTPVTGLRNFIFAFVGTTWSESHLNVPINNGIYTVMLGKFIPIPVSVFNNYSSMNLRITVDGTTLTPDVAITSSGYAIKSDKSDDTKKIAGYEVGSVVPSSQQILKFDGIRWVPANLQWTTTGSDIYYNTGNVGIGTNVPTTQLHTTGSVRFAGLTGTGTVVAIDGTGNLSKTSITGMPSGTFGQTLYHNGSAWAATSTLFNSGPSIGIGTTTPQDQLELTYNFRIPVSTNLNTGVIMKGSNRFIHDYKPPSNTGLNTFVGIQAGNFVMSGIEVYESSRNTGIGYTALTSLGSGYNNTAVGFEALKANTSGYANTSFGAYALDNNTTGVRNTAVGHSALEYNLNGVDNVAVGESALLRNESGVSNTVCGRYAALYTKTGSGNSVFGSQAGQGQLNQSYSNNSLFGEGAGINLTLGSVNTLIGKGSGSSLTTGNNNITLGYNAGRFLTSGSNNIIIGIDLAAPLATGNYQLVIGAQDLLFGDIQNKKIGVGTTTPSTQFHTTGGVRFEGLSGSGSVVAIDGSGNLSKTSLTGLPGGTIGQTLFHDGSSWSANSTLVIMGSNVGIGITNPATRQLELSRSIKLQATTSSDIGVIYLGTDRFIHGYNAPGTTGGNVFIGQSSGNFSFTGAVSGQGSANTGIGKSTLKDLTTGFDNTAVGSYSLMNTTVGNENTGCGYGALMSNQSGSSNSAFGDKTLINNNIGFGNVAMGTSALYSNTGGTYNTAIGVQAGFYSVSGSNNVNVGYNAGLGFGTGITYDNNTLVGASSGLNLTTGSTNILIGYNAGNNITSGSHNIVVGSYKNVPFPTGNSQMVIGDPNLIYGDLVSLRLGIGTTAPNTQLHTTGLVRFAGLTGSGGYVGIDSQGLLYKTTVPEMPGGSNGYTLRHNGTTWESSNMLFNSGSYIGIGKTNPAYALDLYGSGRFQNTSSFSPLFVYGNGATAGGYISNDYSYATCYGAYGVCTNASATGTSSGVYGQNYGYGYGVYGYINNNTAMAVSGINAYSSNYGNLGGASYGAAGYNTNGNFGYIGGVNNGVYADMSSSVDGDYAIYGSGVDVGGVLGSGYGVVQTNGAVKGYNYYGNEYTFGVAGYSYLDYNRSGGNFGAKQDGTSFGILSYKNSSGTIYGGYFTSYTTGTGKSPGTYINSGIGSWGDLFGADIHGKVYGTYTEGENYGLFANGKVFRNDLDVHLQKDASGKNQALYTHVSTDATIMTAGTGVIHAGSCSIVFNESFSSVVSSGEPIIVSLTPIGTTGNLYLKSVTASGFEAGDGSGKGEVQFSFIAIGKRKGYEQPVLPQEVVAADYTDKLSRGLHNDTDMTTNGQGLYFQNGQLTVGVHPSTLPDLNKPTENPENATFKKINTQPRVEPVEMKRGEK